jgi:hypothetical protein
VNGTETRGSGKDDDVCGRDGVLVGVEPDELIVLAHVHALAILAGEIFQSAFEALLEGIRHRHEFYVTPGLEGLVGRA